MTEGRLINPRSVATFAMLFVFWVVFSNHFDSLHLSLGFVCWALVAVLSYDLLFPNAESLFGLRQMWRFCLYIPWLLREIVAANVHVVYLVFRPAQIRPQVVRFRTKLKRDMARAALGNSITLTPGTITLDIQDGEFRVHALSEKAAQSVLTGDMESRVQQVFLGASDEKGT